MLSGVSPFYHKTIRSYVVSFGNLFNEISIQRFDDTNAVTKTIRVPLAYEPRDKWLQRLNQRSSITGTSDNTIEGQEEDPQRVKFTLPRIGFILTGMEYDAERKLNTLQKCVTVNPNDPSGDSVIWQYAPIPYNFNFQLHVGAEYYEDGHQIIEQIMPFFAPHFMLHVKLEDFGTTIDTPLTLNSISPEEEWEGNLESGGRLLVWTLDFTLKGFVYPPTQTTGVIKEIIINKSDILDCGLLTRTTITPDPVDANSGDDYGFTVNVEEF